MSFSLQPVQSFFSHRGRLVPVTIDAAFARIGAVILRDGQRARLHLQHKRVVSDRVVVDIYRETTPGGRWRGRQGCMNIPLGQPLFRHGVHGRQPLLARNSSLRCTFRAYQPSG